MDAERREFFRVMVRLPVSCAALDEKGRTSLMVVRSVDLSAGGVKVVTEHTLVPGNRVRVVFRVDDETTARLDATESSRTTRSLVFTIGLPLVSPTRKDRIRMRSQIRRSVRGLYSSHGKRLTLSHAPATAHSAQNQTVRIHGRAAGRGTTCSTYQ